MLLWLLIDVVADLLNSITLSKTEPEKEKKNLAKVLPQEKAFVILMCINTNLEL